MCLISNDKCISVNNTRSWGCIGLWKMACVKRVKLNIVSIKKVTRATGFMILRIDSILLWQGFLK